MKVFKQIWVNSRNINVIGKAVLKGSEKIEYIMLGKNGVNFNKQKCLPGKSSVTFENLPFYPRNQKKYFLPISFTVLFELNGNEV